MDERMAHEHDSRRQRDMPGGPEGRFSKRSHPDHDSVRRAFYPEWERNLIARVYNMFPTCGARVHNDACHRLIGPSRVFTCVASTVGLAVHIAPLVLMQQRIHSVVSIYQIRRVEPPMVSQEIFGNLDIRKIFARICKHVDCRVALTEETTIGKKGRKEGRSGRKEGRKANEEGRKEGMKVR
jgi:hypothetical protein